MLIYKRPPPPCTPACSPATGWPSSASGARVPSRWTSRGDVRGCGVFFLSARARVQRAYSGSPHFSHLLSNSPLSLGPLGYTGRKTCAQQTWHGGGGSAALPSVDGLRRARISSTSLARRLLMVRIAVSSCRARGGVPGQLPPTRATRLALLPTAQSSVPSSARLRLFMAAGWRAGACPLQAASRCASLHSPPVDVFSE